MFSLYIWYIKFSHSHANISEARALLRCVLKISEHINETLERDSSNIFFFQRRPPHVDLNHLTLFTRPFLGGVNRLRSQFADFWSTRIDNGSYPISLFDVN